MFLFFGCSDNSLGYDRYSSKDPELGIAMDFIPGWLHRESRGSYGSYYEVQFIEPKKDANELPATILVNIKPEEKVKFRPLTLEAMADDLVSKRLTLKDAKLLSRSETSLHGTDAIEILLSYKIPDKIYSVDAKLVLEKERIFLFKEGGRFYTVRYENTAVRFDKFNDDFYKCVKALKFKKS